MLQFPFSFSVSLFLSSTYFQIGLAYNPHLCFIALVKSCPLDHEVNIKYTSILKNSVIWFVKTSSTGYHHLSNHTSLNSGLNSKASMKHKTYMT